MRLPRAVMAVLLVDAADTTLLDLDHARREDRRPAQKARMVKMSAHMDADIDDLLRAENERPPAVGQPMESRRGPRRGVEQPILGILHHRVMGPFADDHGLDGWRDAGPYPVALEIGDEQIAEDQVVEVADLDLLQLLEVIR
ncbi:MAG: hypothetical protein B7Z14_00875 [Bosea sp. 32-68-6]|nr:MAG: hypothetical protein B7Z14_00875 [Bosea sp. 32-68-6]